VDALGHPLRLIPAGGQAADITQGPALVASLTTEAVVADKGYDSNAFIDTIHAMGARAVIPPRSHRLTPRRYDKLARRFNAFLQMACAYIGLL
jgi:transposase